MPRKSLGCIFVMLLVFGFGFGCQQKSAYQRLAEEKTDDPEEQALFIWIYTSHDLAEAIRADEQDIFFHEIVNDYGLPNHVDWSDQGGFADPHAKAEMGERFRMRASWQKRGVTLYVDFDHQLQAYSAGIALHTGGIY